MNGKDDRIQNSEFRGCIRAATFMGKRGLSAENHPPDPLNSRDPRRPFEPGCQSPPAALAKRLGEPSHRLPEVYSILNSEI
jgi:hypothetical protein